MPRVFLWCTAPNVCLYFYQKVAMGRDFYDLMWYIGRKVAPNLHLLNQAMLQTASVDSEILKETFKGYLGEQVGKINFKNVKQDAECFW